MKGAGHITPRHLTDYAARPPAEDNGQGPYNTNELLRMDAAFAVALERAFQCPPCRDNTAYNHAGAFAALHELLALRSEDVEPYADIEGYRGSPHKL
jgi:hypothetical protein